MFCLVYRSSSSISELTLSSTVPELLNAYTKTAYDTFHPIHRIHEFQLPIPNDENNPLIKISSNKLKPYTKSNQKYPPVLTEHSRTQCATVTSHNSYVTPSSKIGLFYTPTAALYIIDISAKKLLCKFIF